MLFSRTLRRETELIKQGPTIDFYERHRPQMGRIRNYNSQTFMPSQAVVGLQQSSGAELMNESMG